MACVYAIEVYGPDSKALSSITAAAFDEVDRIDRLMSHYKPDSPLSLINREAARHPVPVARELFDFISESLRYTQKTAGAFDVTVGPLMKAWGFFRGEGHMPAPGDLSEARTSPLTRTRPQSRSTRAASNLTLAGSRKATRWTAPRQCSSRVESRPL